MLSDRLTVMFCCNDDHGNPQLVVEAVEVDGLIQLEGPAVYDDDLGELVGITLIRWSSAGYVAVGGERFPDHNRRQCVGNLRWDSTEMDRDEVARLLDHLRTLVGWSCVEAETSLFEAWAMGKITAEVLERAIEA